jgi:hypothetical protein
LTRLGAAVRSSVGEDAPHLPLREDDTVLVQEAETVLAIDGAL